MVKSPGDSIKGANFKKEKLKIKNVMTQSERKKRILAYGEHSGHCHVITGNIQFDANGRMVVGDDSNAVLKHLLEKEWMEGKEVWTEEHADIKLATGTYEYVPQLVFDPLSKRIENAKD